MGDVSVYTNNTTFVRQVGNLEPAVKETTKLSYVVFEVDQQKTSGQLHRHANHQQEDVLQQETHVSTEALVTLLQLMSIKPSVDVVPKALLCLVLWFGLVWSPEGYASCLCRDPSTHHLDR